MAKKSRRRRHQERPQVPEEPPTPQEGWISRRTGLVLNTLISVALGLFIGWQTIPVAGPVVGLLWSLTAALSIWLVFWFVQRVTRRMR
jgi:hypothetical protein